MSSIWWPVFSSFHFLVLDFMDIKPHTKFLRDRIIFRHTKVFTKPDLANFGSKRSHNSTKFGLTLTAFELVLDYMDTKLHTKFRRDQIIFRHTQVSTKPGLANFCPKRSHNSTKFGWKLTAFELVLDFMGINPHTKFRRDQIIFRHTKVSTKPGLANFGHKRSHNSTKFGWKLTAFELVLDFIDINPHTKFHRDRITFRHTNVSTKPDLANFGPRRSHNSTKFGWKLTAFELVLDFDDIKQLTKFRRDRVIFSRHTKVSTKPDLANFGPKRGHNPIL